MGRWVLIAALVIGLACPLVFGSGLVLASFMPGCTWAASAPAGGCILLGVNLNGFITLATVAFVGSFFSVPIGIIGAMIGLFIMSSERKSRSEEK
jgi:hypothetical protein